MLTVLQCLGNHDHRASDQRRHRDSHLCHTRCTAAGRVQLVAGDKQPVYRRN